MSVDLGGLDPRTSSREQVTELLTEDALAAYDEREKRSSARLMRALERHILLQIIDVRWKEHLAEMDYLREDPPPRLRQIDPLVAYKNEATSCSGPDGLDLGGVHPPDLPRRRQIEPADVDEAFGPGGSPPTSATRAAPTPSSPRPSPRHAPLPVERRRPPPPRPPPRCGRGGRRRRRHQPRHRRQGRGREDRPQRPLLVWERQEVQSATAPERRLAHSPTPRHSPSAAARPTSDAAHSPTSDAAHSPTSDAAHSPTSDESLPIVVSYSSLAG
ncbi:MAG: hypothetical protein R2691_03845 [Solirubrobacterales bacterium]